jgi:hypothetical protein
MPSPLGHALGGIAAGWLLGGAPSLQPTAPHRAEAGRAASRSGVGERLLALYERDPASWRLTFVWAALGVSPDLDLLFGTHNTYSHSIGAIAVVFAVAWFVTRGRRGLALAAAAAYGSHVPLDWLGHDISAPYGIMALWPLTTAYYYADAELFMAISRRYWQASSWTHNMLAVLREVLILGPALALIWALRRRRTRPVRATAPAQGSWWKVAPDADP